MHPDSVGKGHTAAEQRYLTPHRSAKHVFCLEGLVISAQAGTQPASVRLSVLDSIFTFAGMRGVTH